MSDIPPVPATKFSDNSTRDFIIKEYLQKLKDAVEELQEEVEALQSSSS